MTIYLIYPHHVYFICLSPLIVSTVSQVVAEAVGRKFPPRSRPPPVDMDKTGHSRTFSEGGVVVRMITNAKD